MRWSTPAEFKDSFQIPALVAWNNKKKFLHSEAFCFVLFLFPLVVIHFWPRTHSPSPLCAIWQRRPFKKSSDRKILSPPKRIQGSFWRGGVGRGKWVQAQITRGWKRGHPVVSYACTHSVQQFSPNAPLNLCGRERGKIPSGGLSNQIWIVQMSP